MEFDRREALKAEAQQAEARRVVGLHQKAALQQQIEARPDATRTRRARGGTVTSEWFRERPDPHVCHAIPTGARRAARGGQGRGREGQGDGRLGRRTHRRRGRPRGASNIENGRPDDGRVAPTGVCPLWSRPWAGVCLPLPSDRARDSLARAGVCRSDRARRRWRSVVVCGGSAAGGLSRAPACLPRWFGSRRREPHSVDASLDGGESLSRSRGLWRATNQRGMRTAMSGRKTERDGASASCRRPAACCRLSVLFLLRLRTPLTIFGFSLALCCAWCCVAARADL